MGIFKRQNQRMPFQVRADDPALDTFAAAMNEPDFINPWIWGRTLGAPLTHHVR